MIYPSYFDIGMIMDYWGPERLNPHTEATSMLFAARECARVILEEGLDHAIARHRLQRGDAGGHPGHGAGGVRRCRAPMNKQRGVMIRRRYRVNRYGR